METTINIDGLQALVAETLAIDDRPDAPEATTPLILETLASLAAVLSSKPR